MELDEILTPILKKGFRIYHLNSQDQEDVFQEVYKRIFARLAKKGLGQESEKYIRKSAKFETKKLCLKILQRHQREFSLEANAREIGMEVTNDD